MNIERVSREGIEYTATRMETVRNPFSGHEEERPAIYRFRLSLPEAEQLLAKLPRVIADIKLMRHEADKDRIAQLRKEIAAKQDELKFLEGCDGG